MNSITPNRIVIRLATEQERREIYRARHDVYARELGQHAQNSTAELSDALDTFNIYIVASLNEKLAGFISITPPDGKSYSIDKYICRADFPELCESELFELRLLTVIDPFRGRGIASALMYAALRWVESRGGERIVAIGRKELLDLYLHVGLEKMGHSVRSGAVQYELLTAKMSRMRARLNDFAPLLRRLERTVEWRLKIPFRKTAGCFHGGAFFDAIGPEFNALERRNKIINADVLDAWYPPSPRVIAALQEDLPWLLRTSPPTGCEGMINAIARARGIPSECVLPAAGSSDAIFLALRQWLNPSSRVLILDPMYGEYAHILEQVIHCRVDRVILSRENGYRVDPSRLEMLLHRAYDLVVLVNPNNPTGRHVPRSELQNILSRAPVATRFWIDETYIEFAGAGESLERFAAASENVVVCKSMSKIYALSGARAAYLCGPKIVIEELRALTPPWAVSLLAQVAAVAALQDPKYYFERHQQTRQLRERFVKELSEIVDWEILPGVANFVLCHLPETGPGAATIVQQCRTEGLFLRDVGAMGRSLGAHSLRIAIKDAETNQRMLGILRRAVHFEDFSRDVAMAR
jgi:histidinol-phosphate/aromatic aminotransferase/cobyric acid decarboxylase-like protein/GNAT superfamily N-acetyltransferase